LYEGRQVSILKILVVDDHALVREGLCQVLLGLAPDEPTQVLQALNCAEAFAVARGHPDLDLVLLDYHLPDMNGLAGLEILGQRHPELPVVILSGSANPSILQQALSKGAAGFITKSALSQELLQTLRSILNGEVFKPGAFAPLSTQSFASTPCHKPPPVLNDRQKTVLDLLFDGKTNPEISVQLNLSLDTVKFHISNIYRILGVKTRTHAVLEARRWGYDRSARASR